MSSLSPGYLLLLTHLIDLASPEVKRNFADNVDRLLDACDNSDNRFDDVLAAAVRYLLGAGK